MPVLRWLAVATGLVCVLVAGGAAAQDVADATRKPGTHLVLSLDMAEARTSWLTSMRDDVRTNLREAKIGVGRLGIADNAVHVRLAKPEDVDAALKALADLAPAAPSGLLERLLNAVRGAQASDVTFAKGEGGVITVAPTEAGFERRANAALEDVVAIAGRRLEGMRIAASAVRLGRDRIHVHAPGVLETVALKELLTRSAQLSFREVHPTMSAEQARAAQIPVGFKIYASPFGEMLLRDGSVVRGSDLADAQAIVDHRTSEPIITFRFNSTGARAFGRYTSENIGKPFAVLLDETVLAAPVIREPILGGSGQVSGNFTMEEARQLAVQLRAGVLPAKLVVVEERVVPASR